MALTPYPTLGTLTLDGVEESGVEWRCRPVQGWAGAPVVSSTGKKPREHGVWAGVSYLDARHPVLSGSVWAPSEVLLDDAIDRLNAAASLSDTTLTLHTASGDRWAIVRREGEVLAPSITPQYAEWSILLLATDPRRFAADLTASTLLPSSTGGLVIPFTIPLMISATTITGQVSLTNPGNIAGPVHLRIDGPVTGPIVTHVSSGRSLVFSSSVVLGAGEWIDVDMERREVLANGTASRNGWVTGRGWSAFDPALNTWAFTAAVADPASLLTVTATQAWQ